MVLRTAVERNWLFYLIQPLRLLEDCKSMSLDEQLTLLKQFLSQAEISVRPSIIGNGKNEMGDVPELLESSQIYKKAKVLDVLALQLAAFLKFNLNLFQFTAEIPIRLLARLYRVLMTITSKKSPSLLETFDGVEDKDDISVVNPYALFSWQNLHPTNTYAILSYHIWCMQVALSSNMLANPSRDLTPAVSGLTEIPSTVFVADNHVEIKVIVSRIDESVAQISRILNLLDSLTIARPFPTAFPFPGSTLSVERGASAGTGVTDSNEADESEILSKEYWSIALQFLLGRHFFQQQQLGRAEDLFDASLKLMEKMELVYVEEVGVTPKLLKIYLEACLSRHSKWSSPVPLSVSLRADKFVAMFCDKLEQELTSCSDDTHDTTVFWHNRCNDQNDESLTFESVLCQHLLSDLLIDDDKTDQVTSFPLGCSLRERLESLSTKRLLLAHSRHINQPLQGSNAKSLDWFEFTACQQLHSKIRICNAIERLFSGFFLVTNRLTTSLLHSLPEPNPRNHNEDTVMYKLDPVLSGDWLLTCFHRILCVISKQFDQWSVHRYRLSCQFLAYLVQEGLLLMSSDCSSVPEYDVIPLRYGFQRLLTRIAEHPIMELLPTTCQSFIRSSLKVALNCATSNSPPPLLPTPIRGVGPSTSSTLSNTTFGRGLDIWPDETELNWFDGNAVDNKLQTMEHSYRSEFLKHPSTTSSTITSSLFTSSKDVDMRTLQPSSNMGFPFAPSPNYRPPIPVSNVPINRSPFVAPFDKPKQLDYKFAYDFMGSRLSLSSLPLINMLLSTVQPNEVATCSRRLLDQMNPMAVLELNASWIPTLRRLARLELQGAKATKEATDPIGAALAVSTNIAGLVTLLIQLAKASLLINHELPQFEEIRDLLMAAANGSSVVESCRWLHAALRHEQLLLDLKQALYSRMSQSPMQTSSVRHSSIMSKQTSNRFPPTDLLWKSKVYLFYATGLVSNATALEGNLQTKGPPVLTTDLVAFASCFLIMNGEHEFILPPNKHKVNCLPVGSLSSRGSHLGCLELLRALLRVHYASLKSQQQDKTHTEPTTTSSLLKTVDDRSSHLGHSRTIQNLPDRLRTAINNLWNLVVFGCLAPELIFPAQSESKSTTDRRTLVLSGRSGVTEPSGRSQLKLNSLILVVRLLAACVKSGAEGTLSYCPNPKSSGKREPNAEGNMTKIKGSDIAHHLLYSLISCLIHITQTVCTDFRLRRPAGPTESDPVSQTSEGSSSSEPVQVTPSSINKEAGETGSTEASSASKHLRSESLKVDKGLNMDHCSTTLQSSSILFHPAWPDELPPKIQLPNDALSDLLLFMLNTCLDVSPGRVDWLLVRAELQFSRGQYRAALSAYLELLIIATDAFGQLPPAHIFSERLILHLIQSCQALGLLAEAVVLCQFSLNGCSNPDLMDLAFRIIDGQHDQQSVVSTSGLSNTASEVPGIVQPEVSNRSTKTNNGISSDAEPESTNTTATVNITGNNGVGGSNNNTGIGENQRDFFTGTFDLVTLNHIDHFIEYIHDVQLLERLSSSAMQRGALGLHAKFTAAIRVPERNVNNPEEALQETSTTRILNFLSLLTDMYLL